MRKRLTPNHYYLISTRKLFFLVFFLLIQTNISFIFAYEKEVNWQVVYNDLEDYSNTSPLKSGVENCLNLLLKRHCPILLSTFYQLISKTQNFDLISTLCENPENIFYVKLSIINYTPKDGFVYEIFVKNSFLLTNKLSYLVYNNNNINNDKKLNINNNLNYLNYEEENIDFYFTYLSIFPANKWEHFIHSIQNYSIENLSLNNNYNNNINNDLMRQRNSHSLIRPQLGKCSNDHLLILLYFPQSFAKFESFDFSNKNNNNKNNNNNNLNSNLINENINNNYLNNNNNELNNKNDLNNIKEKRWRGEFDKRMSVITKKSFPYIKPFQITSLVYSPFYFFNYSFNEINGEGNYFVCHHNHLIVGHLVKFVLSFQLFFIIY